MFRWFLVLFFVLIVSTSIAFAQSRPSGDPPSVQDKSTAPTDASIQMNGVQMNGMQMGGEVKTLEENVLRHSASGTSLEPGAVSPSMLMTMDGGWMLMLHGQAMVAEQQQTGARGRDKLFSVNWFMPMAQRHIGYGQLTLRAMLSFEPATISGRYYPELFQQGETAFGKAIVDGQHPHNLFMEIAGIYDYHASDRWLLSIYAAPVGDPAMGPVAYPHRASAMEDPLAPLGHHLEDSTHISYEVLTGGATFGGVHWEASGFHGREPGENRWTIAVGGLDSWSTRVTVAPTRAWAMQYSVGHLHSPEALHPEEDVLRQTASIAYHHDWGSGERVSTLDGLLLWGRNHTIGTPTNANGYLLEATGRIRGRDSLWTRVENVDRTTDLLGDDAPEQESVVGRVQAYTAGYAHCVYRNGWSRYNLGAQATFYDTPVALRSLYGDHPFGLAAVLHVHLGR